MALRYTGVRSGRQFTLPARYASNDDDIVIMVGRPERKTWWRNFRTGRDVEVLRAGQWRLMTAHAVEGASEPERTASLLAIYHKRFPRSAAVPGHGLDDDGLRRTVMVRCCPR